MHNQLVLRVNPQFLKNRFLDEVRIFLRQIALRLKIEDQSEKNKKNALDDLEKDNGIKRRGATFKGNLRLFYRGLVQGGTHVPPFP